MIETVTCPHCKKRLQLSAEHMGMRVQCPSCETAFTAGEAPPPVLVPTPAAIKTPETAIPDMSLDAQPSETKRKDQPKFDDEDAPLPRARRRARPVRPKAPPSYKMPILFAVLGGLVLIGGLIAYTTRSRPIAMPNVKNFRAQAKFDNNPQEFQMPPRSQAPEQILNADEQKNRAAAFFQHFAAVMRNRTIDNERAAYDVPHMVDTLFAQNALPNAWRGERAQLIRNFRDMIPTVVLNPSDRWVNYEIKKVKQPQPRELIVVTRHPNPGVPGALRFRWWLKHDGTRWLIQDMEDIDYGVRLSTLIALRLEPMPNNTGVLPHRHLRTLDDAAKAVLTKDDFNEADRLLKNERTDDLARAYVVLHHMLLAGAQNRQHRNPDVIRSCEIVQNVEPDMPGCSYLFAIALSNTNRSAEALQQIKKAQAWLGDDPSICYEFGLVYHQLRRYNEASTYYRKVLDAEPDHGDAFVQLIRVLGAGGKNDDIAGRFERMKDPKGRFEQFANECWKNRNIATLEVLAAAMRRKEPRYAEAVFYYALTLADRQKVPAALKSLKEAMSFQLDGQRRDYYCTEFARIMAERDQAFEAYPAMPNAPQAFRALAESLKNFGKIDDLQRLIDLHAKTNPNDPYLLLFQADIHLRNEKYALADASFTKAFAKINDPGLADRFRMDRVRTRYQLGDIVGAYRELAPQRMTFQQLGDLCWLDKKYDDLQKLIDLHAKDDAIDPQLGRFRTRLDFAMKRFDEAGKRLKAAVAGNGQNDQSRFLIEDFLFDAVDAGQALEGYRQCPNPTVAMEILANDLNEMNLHKALDDILDEHRKNYPKDPILLMMLGQRAAAKNDWATAAQNFKDGWSGIPEINRPRWSYAYLQSRFKLGQAVQAHQETGFRLDHLRQLASMILLEKNVDLFEKLVQAHRAHSNNEPEFAAYDARLQILRGNPAGAAQSMAACMKDLPIVDQRRVGDSFVNDLTKFDVGVELYRCMPDKLDAFGHMTWQYRNVERAKELERLIAEHAKNHPEDPRLASERGELHLLRGEFKFAETQFTIAKKNDNAQNYNVGRFGLIRARIKLGKAVETYNEFGKNAVAFQDIASQCLQQKNAEQLERIVAAHRAANPKTTNLASWDVDIQWLKKDYEATLKTLRANDSALLKNNLTKWKCEGYLIRSLVRLKKSEEAVREAEAMNQRKYGPQILLALALSSTGDVKRTITYLESATGNRYLIEDSYRDDDLGPILRGEAYRELQQRHPPPPPLPKAP